MLYRSDYLRLEFSERIATLWLDTSVLDRALLCDLREALNAMHRSGGTDVLVVRGGEAGNFLTGPDLDEYTGLTDPESRRARALLTQETMQQLEELSPRIATVAYIDGTCTGAGLELALACDFRLAVARPETWLAADFAPQGLLPCGGITQRLPRLIGPQAALDSLTEGTPIPARAAKKLGLVDHAFGQRPAKTELWWFLVDVVNHERRRRPRPWWQRVCDHALLTDKTLFSPLLARLAGDDLARPIVEAMRRGWRFGAAAGYAAERAAFAEFGLYPGGAGRRQLARERQALIEQWSKIETPRRVGITTLDETGLALAVDALAGGAAVVIDLADPARLRLALRQGVNAGRFTVLEAEDSLRRVTSGNHEALAHCDLVFLTGSSTEQAGALLALDRDLPPHVALAMNAPELPLARFTARLAAPERVIGLNFAPSLGVDRAVELMPTQWTDERVVGSLFRWMQRSGRWPFVTVAVGTKRELVAA